MIVNDFTCTGTFANYQLPSPSAAMSECGGCPWNYPPPSISNFQEDVPYDRHILCIRFRRQPHGETILDDQPRQGES